MDEVLKRRLVGATALMGGALLVSWLLPSPTDTPPAESGQTAVTFDLTQPEIAQLPPAKLPAPETPLPQTIAEPAAEPIRASQTPLPEPDDVQSPEQDMDRQSFLAVKPRIIESAAPVEPASATPTPTPAAVAAAPVEKPAALEKPAAKPEPKPVLPEVETSEKTSETAAPASPAKPKPDAAKPVVKPVPPPVVATKPAIAPATAAQKPSSAPAAPPPAVAASRFFAQVGSFTEVDGARRTQDQLKAQNYKSLISPADTPSGTRYRVRVGPYPTREAALAARDSLVSKGYASPTVVED